MGVEIFRVVLAIILGCAITMPGAVSAAPKVSFGAAPKGDPSKVASKIIKENFPKCKQVSGAKRMPDGSIRAKCDGSNFWVFTAFNRQEGRVVELAMNCTVLKKRLDIDC